MRIGLITSSCPIAATDGIARQRQMLGKTLAALGHDVHLFTIGEKACRAALGGATVHTAVRPRYANPWFRDLPVLDWPLTDSQLLWELVMREHDVAPLDVVDVPLWMAQGGLLIERPPCPVVLWLQTSLAHLIELQSRPPRPHERVLLALEARALAQASLVLGDSHVVLDDLQRLHDQPVEPQRARVVWPGIDDAAQVWTWDRPLRERIDVLVVGRLEHRKGTAELLDLLPALLRERPAAHITFVGADNSNADGFKRRTGRTYPEAFFDQHPDLADRVSFLGRVPDETLFEAYRQADLLVHPARYESFGLALIEAMRAGLPAVAFGVAGASEIHDATSACLVPAHDWTKLIDAVLSLTADRERRLTIGRAARARFEQVFSADAMSVRTIAAYQDAIQLRRRESSGAAATGVTGTPAARPGKALESPAADDEWRLYQITEALTSSDGVGRIVRTQSRLLEPFGGVRPIQTLYVEAGLASETGRIAATVFAPADVAMLHVHGYSRLERLFASVSARRLVHYHNITPPHYFPPRSATFEMTTRGLAQLPRLAALADMVTGDSDFNVRELAAVLPAPRPALTLYPLIDRDQLNGHPIDRDYLDALVERKARTREIVLLFVGRIARNKRQDLLVAAADRLAAGGDRPVRLMLVGGVSDPLFRDELDAAVRRAKHVTVDRPGLLPDTQLYACYRVADAFVSASEHEGFGMPLAEAMAFGVPVLAAAHAAVPETLGESGILLPAWDEVRAAAEISRLMDRAAARAEVVRRQYINIERFSEAALRDRLRDLVAYLRDGRQSATITFSDALLPAGTTS